MRYLVDYDNILRYLVGYDEKRGFLALHLEDHGFKPCYDVHVALPSWIPVAEFIRLARRVFLRKRGFNLGQTR